MLNIGTISHGTLRPQDLLRSFSEAYEQYGASDRDYNDSLVHEARFLADYLDQDANPDFEAVDFCLDDLIEELEKIAARYNCYFGTTEGDGSDFGFWPNEGGEA